MIEDAKINELREYVQQHAGQRLATERELAAQFSISRPRLRTILALLENENLVHRRQGSGTYALSSDARKLQRVLVLLDISLKLGDDPFISRVVERLQSELQDFGTQCIIHKSSGEDDGPWNSCDGILALGSTSVNTVSTHIETPVPTVGLFAPKSTRAGAKLSLLELEDEDAGRRAARRLVRQGVQRIYFCGRRDLSVVSERVGGVESELQQTAVPLECFDCGLNYASGLQLGIKFPSPSEERIGIIAANDWLAVGLHTGLQSSQPELRSRASMISFDGLPLTQHRELGITSMAVPLETMIVDAVAELQRLKRPRTGGRTIRYDLEWSPQT